MESETFYQAVLTRKQHIFRGRLILTGFAQSWKVLEVWVESLKSLGSPPSILVKTLKSLLNPWRVLECFPTVSITEPKAKLVCINSERIFKYTVHVTVGVVSPAFIWLFIYYSRCLKLKINPSCPYFQMLDIQTCKFGCPLESLVAHKNNVYP